LVGRLPSRKKGGVPEGEGKRGKKITEYGMLSSLKKKKGKRCPLRKRGREKIIRIQPRCKEKKVAPGKREALYGQARGGRRGKGGADYSVQRGREKKKKGVAAAPVLDPKAMKRKKSPTAEKKEGGERGELFGKLRQKGEGGAFARKEEGAETNRDSSCGGKRRGGGGAWSPGAGGGEERKKKRNFLTGFSSEGEKRETSFVGGKKGRGTACAVDPAAKRHIEKGGDSGKKGRSRDDPGLRRENPTRGGEKEKGASRGSAEPEKKKKNVSKRKGGWFFALRGEGKKRKEINPPLGKERGSVWGTPNLKSRKGGGKKRSLLLKRKGKKRVVNPLASLNHFPGKGEKEKKRGRAHAFVKRKGNDPRREPAGGRGLW